MAYSKIKQEDDMTRKRGFMVAGIVVAALLVTILAGSMVAQAVGPKWAGGFHRCGWGHHGGPGGKTMVDFALWKMDETVKGLNLTSTQKEKYDKLRDNVKSHGVQAVEEHKALRNEMHAEMVKDVPDLAAVAPKLKTAVGAMSGEVQNNIDLIVDFYASLDNSQKKKVMSTVKDRME
jgi:periplasmic protein CpxP/Spy